MFAIIFVRSMHSKKKQLSHFLPFYITDLLLFSFNFTPFCHHNPIPGQNVYFNTSDGKTRNFSSIQFLLAALPYIHVIVLKVQRESVNWKKNGKIEIKITSIHTLQYTIAREKITSEQHFPPKYFFFVFISFTTKSSLHFKKYTYTTYTQTNITFIALTNHL